MELDETVAKRSLLAVFNSLSDFNATKLKCGVSNRLTMVSYYFNAYSSVGHESIS